MSLLACSVAAVVYVWQEQHEYSFPPICLAVVILGVGVMSLGLCLFQRGTSRVQPPEAIAGAVRFMGRHTLEIYALQLIVSELIIKWFPVSPPDPNAALLAPLRGFERPLVAPVQCDLNTR